MFEKESKSGYDFKNINANFLPMKTIFLPFVQAEGTCQ